MFYCWLASCSWLLCDIMLEKGRGYQVSHVDKGFDRHVARPGNGESTNTFVNEAYSVDKVNY